MFFCYWTIITTYKYNINEISYFNDTCNESARIC